MRSRSPYKLKLGASLTYFGSTRLRFERWRGSSVGSRACAASCQDITSLIPTLLALLTTGCAIVPVSERLNAYHRNQLKKILNIRYPKKIKNKSLYRICHEKPLSIQILSACWSLFVQILRRDKDIPANKATRAYFIPNGNKLRGRPKTTLPIVFNRDLTLIQHSIRLHSSD